MDNSMFFVYELQNITIVGIVSYTFFLNSIFICCLRKNEGNIERTTIRNLDNTVYWGCRCCVVRDRVDSPTRILLLGELL